MILRPGEALLSQLDWSPSDAGLEELKCTHFSAMTSLQDTQDHALKPSENTTSMLRVTETAPSWHLGHYLHVMQGQNHPSHCLDRFAVDLRYLVDGKPPKIVMAKTILVSSPDHDIIKVNGH